MHPEMTRKKLCFLSLLWLASSMLVPGEFRAVRPLNETVEEDDEDVDLEDVLQDYYDDLFEIWASELEANNSESAWKEKESPKPKREEEKSESEDRPVEDTSGDGTESYFDMAVPIRIGNYTYRYLNRSYSAILDLQRANRERETDEGSPTRIKEMRVSSIRDYVLSLRGGNCTNVMTFPKQTKTLEKIFEKQLKNGPEWSSSSNMYAEKYQSFYPSCDVPKNADETLWADSNSMNLLFDVYFPTPQKGSALVVVDAILRLYTVSQGNSTRSIDNISVPGIRIQMDRTSVNIPNFSLIDAEDEKQIRISVYWYTKALRKQNVKKLLGSQMIPLHGDRNLTFNIRAAVRSWKKSGKNFGLVVTVEDEDGTLLKASNYISPMNCSKWAATVKPLPLFGFDSPIQYFIEDTKNGTSNETNYDDEGSHFGNQRPVKYPILGLRTREVSHSEMKNLAMLTSAKLELESGKYNFNRRNSKSPGQDGTSRVTYFENVSLGSPISRTRTRISDSAEESLDPGRQQDQEDVRRNGRKSPEAS